MRDRPKTIVAAPNTATAPSILTPTLCFSGRNENQIAISAAPTAGAARSMAEAVGADVQDVAREHRQQRRRAAEQHREQIERDRAEHEPVAADIGSPSTICCHGLRRALDRRSAAPGRS